MRWLLVVTLVFAGHVSAQESARQWLDQMSEALQTLDYDGTFVYLYDGKLETMRIVHKLTDGGVKERLVSLTGSPREVLRDDRAVTCIMPDNKSVMIGKSRPRTPFPEVPRDLDTLSRYYQLEDSGDERMTGYDTRVITIRPKDALRYGYRFWIDRQSKMLLKYDLTGVDGKPIEQVMFTSLGVGKKINDAALKPSLTGEGFTWYRQENRNMGAGAHHKAARWAVGRLPAGFSLVNLQYKRMREDHEAVEHMVFTDGLATVSVYIEKISAGNPDFSGLSSMGAMNAYRTQVEGHQVTVVGEVPSDTLQMIAHSINRRS